MSCERMESRILGYVDGRLKESERLEVEKHLAGCAPCSLRVHEFSAVSGLLDDLPLIEPSPEFDTRVYARVAAEPQPDQQPLGIAIAQLHGLYILAQSSEGLILVDTHAAHERVIYEQLKSQYQGGAPASQLLLEPLSVAVGEHEIDALLAESGEFDRVGFEIERHGPERLAVRRVPALLVGISSDWLYPVEEVKATAASLGPSADYVEFQSDHGHDGFLADAAQLSAIVRPFLEERALDDAAAGQKVDDD